MPIYNPSLEQTATLIVAASDSLYPERADRTCDGTADDVEINAALALGAANTRVVLMDGTYTLADSIVFTNNNQTLEGQGRATFIDGDGLATTEHAIIATGLTNIAIKNLAIQTADGGGGTIHCIFLDDGCNDFLIDKVVIVDSDSDGIHIAGTNVVGGTIVDCIIADVDDHGIYVDVDAANTAARITIKNNRIAGAGADGLYVGATGAGSPYWNIEGNNIVSSTQNGMELYELTFANIVNNVVHTSTFHGIILGAGSSHNNVEGNQSYNNARHGIGLVDCTENTLIGNTCNGNDSGNTNTYCGIHIQACNYTTVVGNHCYDNDMNGICILRCSYCVITGNNCHENTQGDGITITGDGTANSDYNIISDNNASGNGSDGISVVGGADANGNHITGNYVASNSVYGITVAGPDTKIEANHIYHNGGGAAGTYHGIYLAGTSDRCSVNNNIIGDDGTDTEDGINLADGAINCQISGNYIYNLMGDGIRLMANNTSTVVHDNYCLTLDENGIAITDSVDCTVSGNHCENNTHHGIYLDNVDEANVSNNYCRGNDRLNAATYDGIYVDVDSSYVNIVGNHCTENDRYGIYVLSTTCELTANHALTNTTGQISAAAGCVLAHNETGAVAEVHVPREATIVVAASNSVTASADRICSGAADDVDINAALTAAGAGGRVMLLEGTYTLADPIAFTNNNQVLEGQGRGTFIDGDGLATTEHAISITTLTNCEIKNLAIQTEDGGAKTCHCIFLNDGANYTKIDNVTIVDSDDNGIHIEGTNATDIKITNCTIEDADGHGIFVDMDAANTMSRLVIEGNKINGVGADGIHFGTTPAATGYLWCLVINNIISSSGSDGIYASWTQHSDFSGNAAVSNGAVGIWLTSACHYNTVTANRCDGNTTEGIYIHQSDHNTIADNNCEGNTTEGIHFHDGLDNTVSGNVCYNNSQNGIYVGGASLRCICSGNTCNSNTQHGMLIEQSADSAITGNTCSRNDYGNITYCGLYVSTSSRVTITGNQCSENGSHGIRLWRSSYCTVTGNSCHNSNYRDGIYLEGDGTVNTDYNTLVGNTCYGNDDDGIEIVGGANANKNIVLGNQLSGNSGTALVDGGTNTHIGHNITA